MVELDSCGWIQEPRMWLGMKIGCRYVHEGCGETRRWCFVSGHLDAGDLCSNGCMEDMGRQDDDVLSPISRIQVIMMQICAWRMWGDKTMVFCLRTSGCRRFVFKWMHGGYGETGWWCLVSNIQDTSNKDADMCMEDVGRQDDGVLAPDNWMQDIYVQMDAWRIWGDRMMMSCLQYPGYK